MALFLLATGIFFLRLLPVLRFYFTRGDRVFLGLSSLFNSDDIWNYWADMMTGQKGHFFYFPWFGAGEKTHVLIRPIYTLLGYFSQRLNLEKELVYFLASYFLTLLLAWALYRFAELFFKEPAWRLLVVVFCLFSGPPNFSLPVEAVPFLSLLEPHFILVHLSMILVFFQFLTWERSKKSFDFGKLAVIFLGAFLVSWIHIFMSLVVIGVIFIWLLVSFELNRDFKLRKFFLPFAMLVGASLPMFFYSVYISRQDFFQETFLKKDVLSSASPLVIFSCCGAFIFLIPFVFRSIRKKREVIFLVVWLILQFLLMYFPANFQRRMSEGWWIAACFLLFLGLFVFKKFLKERLFYLLFIMFLFFGVSGIGLVLVEMGFWAPLKRSVYVSSEEEEVWKFLKAGCGFEKRVLTTLSRGVYIPAKTGCRSYIGQKVETPNYWQKRANVERFLSQENSVSLLEGFLKREGIDFIFLTLEDGRKLGFGNLENYGIVFENGSFVVYGRNI